MRFYGKSIEIHKLELRALLAHTDPERTGLCGGVHFDRDAGYAFATDANRIARLDAETGSEPGTGLLSLTESTARTLCSVEGARQFRIGRGKTMTRVEIRDWSGDNLCVCYFAPAAPVEVTELVRQTVARPEVDAPRAPVFSINPEFLADLRRCRKAVGRAVAAIDERFVAPAEALSAVVYMCGPWTVVIMPQRNAEAVSFDNRTKAWRAEVAPVESAALVAKAEKSAPRAGKGAKK